MEFTENIAKKTAATAAASATGAVGVAGAVYATNESSSVEVEEEQEVHVEDEATAEATPQVEPEPTPEPEPEPTPLEPGDVDTDEVNPIEPELPSEIPAEPEPLIYLNIDNHREFNGDIDGGILNMGDGNDNSGQAVVTGNGNVVGTDGSSVQAGTVAGGDINAGNTSYDNHSQTTTTNLLDNSVHQQQTVNDINFKGHDNTIVLDNDQGGDTSDIDVSDTDINADDNSYDVHDSDASDYDDNADAGYDDVVDDAVDDMGGDMLC